MSAPGFHRSRSRASLEEVSRHVAHCEDPWAVGEESLVLRTWDLLPAPTRGCEEGPSAATKCSDSCSLI